jgi:hypothetical protein
MSIGKIYDHAGTHSNYGKNRIDRFERNEKLLPHRLGWALPFGLAWRVSRMQKLQWT